MAGVKGRSGGPRKNAGGARPGAGRKRTKPVENTETVPVSGEKDMLELLQDVALGRIESTPLQVRAAIAAVQYTHAKRGEGGKKEDQQRAAEQAASKFSRQSPPKLVAKDGKQV